MGVRAQSTRNFWVDRKRCRCVTSKLIHMWNSKFAFISVSQRASFVQDRCAKDGDETRSNLYCLAMH